MYKGAVGIKKDIEAGNEVAIVYSKKPHFGNNSL
jgi:hypothetical protein